MSQNKPFHETETFQSISHIVKHFGQLYDGQFKSKADEVLFGLASCGGDAGITSIELLDLDDCVIIVKFTFETSDNLQLVGFARIDDKPAITAIHQAMLDAVQNYSRCQSLDYLKLQLKALDAQYEHDKAILNDKISRDLEMIEILKNRIPYPSKFGY